jgi:hypothetical protein
MLGDDKPITDFLVRLDLGQSSDPTAMCVVEQTILGRRPTYAAPHLKRWPPGTSYPAIVAEVAALLGRPPLLNCSLVVDQTGVGRTVTDLLREDHLQAYLYPVTITAGRSATNAHDGFHVPKMELVSTLQVIFQARRLRIAKTLPDAEALERELLGFQVRLTAAANETFGAWRENQHDALVLAVALACWCGERYGPHTRYTDPLVLYGPEDALAEREEQTWRATPAACHPASSEAVDQVLRRIEEEMDREAGW